MQDEYSASITCLPQEDLQLPPFSTESRVGSCSSCTLSQLSYQDVSLSLQSHFSFLVLDPRHSVSPLHCIFNYFIVLLCCLSYLVFSTTQGRQFIWCFSFTEVLIQMATRSVEVVLLAGSPMTNSRYTNFKYILLLLLSAQHLGYLPNMSLQTQGHTHIK